ncbi:hypothetical protein [Streptomyces justiciae]|uniref:hypothetical protein n=1 Tax=Streptomyces justiciae TaxID=2780140 RepID=UPI00187F7A98|nr:hypothetical protein [Streptomyces justiciae]MBE8475641.1 hypothetical protein [Streptomyces justiciae]MCW8382567.1 hypothetical protein [Streptomyces justiciae]
MVSAAHTTQSIESTAENLREELLRLEVQRQSLERELAAVVAHLGSVQTALHALQDLMRTPPLSARTEPAGPEPQRAPDRPSGRRRVKAVDTSDSSLGGYGRLTEQILQFLASSGGADVRAREVAAALGRDTDAGSINAVRSTLDRLVGTSRVERAGRGLYRAKTS